MCLVVWIGTRADRHVAVGEPASRAASNCRGGPASIAVQLGGHNRRPRGCIRGRAHRMARLVSVSEGRAVAEEAGARCGGEPRGEPGRGGAAVLPSPTAVVAATRASWSAVSGGLEARPIGTICALLKLHRRLAVAPKRRFRRRLRGQLLLLRLHHLRHLVQALVQNGLNLCASQALREYSGNLICGAFEPPWCVF